MKTATCPVCDFHQAEERAYDDTVTRDSRQALVRGLRHYVCPQCEADFSDDEQSRRNLTLVQAAFGDISPRFLSPQAIRAWRDRIGLTQRQAARIFGGGLNAFSKYENGEVTQTEAMDNLLWVAMTYPGLVPALAKRREVQLAEHVVEECGYVVQSSATWLQEFTAYLTVFGDPDVEVSRSTRERFTYSPTARPANDEEFNFLQQA